jgi:hypothetical protein
MNGVNEFDEWWSKCGKQEFLEQPTAKACARLAHKAGMVDALQKWGVHQTTCAQRATLIPMQCSCGLRDAIAAL